VGFGKLMSPGSNLIRIFYSFAVCPNNSSILITLNYQLARDGYEEVIALCNKVGK
jgi:hypothetical protein